MLLLILEDIAVHLDINTCKQIWYPGLIIQNMCNCSALNVAFTWMLVVKRTPFNTHWQLKSFLRFDEGPDLVEMFFLYFLVFLLVRETINTLAIEPKGQRTISLLTQFLSVCLFVSLYLAHTQHRCPGMSAESLRLSNWTRCLFIQQRR